MQRSELQLYFDKIYPYSEISKEETIGGQINIRFELGGKHKNATKRVSQATERSWELFNETFNNPSNEIWVLIYDYGATNPVIIANDYLYQQFPKKQQEKFYNQIEEVPASYSNADENGYITLGTSSVRIVIGRLPVKEIGVKNILKGIANAEMALEPAIDQKIFFFDPQTDKAFHMYDDRGCYVWSNKADKIRDIYTNHNDWIVDYHRPEIDLYFK